MRPCKAIKIEARIANRAKVVAAHKGVSTSDYISDSLVECVERDEADMVRELGESNPLTKPGAKPGAKGKARKKKAGTTDNGDPHDGPHGSPSNGQGPAARLSDEHNLGPMGGPPAPKGKGRRRGDGLGGGA